MAGATDLPLDNPPGRLWLFPACKPGVLQKLHLALFYACALAIAFFWRADWVYSSDWWISPAACVLVRLGRKKVVYHEHDTPVGLREGSRWGKWISFTRRTLARNATLCVLPNELRLSEFRRDTGTHVPAIVVWNCPSRSEARPKLDADTFVVHYHGGIGEQLLPEALIEAIAAVSHALLRIVGLMNRDSHVRKARLLNTCERYGVRRRVEFVEPLPRAELLELCRSSSVGWAAMPAQTTNPNFMSMVGASNKVFDYLACGIPVLVSRDPEWRRNFVESGFARSCDPANAHDIARQLIWFFEHPTEARSMGQSGQQRILNEWNYETQFEPVRKTICTPMLQRRVSQINPLGNGQLQL